MGVRTSFPDLFRPGRHSLSFRGSNSDSPWQLEFPSNKGALRDYLMSPCARWCGRALSSSWKLPPRGARRARPGEGSGGDAHAPSPGGGLCAPALLPAGRGGKAREGEGRERGAETGVGGRLPAPPPARRTTGSRCCPLPPTAPRAPARPGEGRRGRRSRWGRGNRSRHL